MTVAMKNLLMEAAKHIEETGVDEDDPAVTDLLGRIHQAVTAEDENYVSFDDWIEQVRRANICDLMA